MPKPAIEFIRHMHEEGNFILKNTVKVDLDELLQNEVLKRPIVRSLEIIGEAAKKVDEETRLKYSEIEWRSMAKMRDKLIHHYFGVDYEIVLDVAKNKIPELVHQLELILADN